MMKMGHANLDIQLYQLFQSRVDKERNDFEMIWGQFLDHDLDKTLASSSRQSFATGKPLTMILMAILTRHWSLAVGSPLIQIEPYYHDPDHGPD